MCFFGCQDLIRKRLNWFFRSFPLQFGEGHYSSEANQIYTHPRCTAGTKVSRAKKVETKVVTNVQTKKDHQIPWDWFIRLLGFFGFEKSCASELWTFPSGKWKPLPVSILFWASNGGLVKGFKAIPYDGIFEHYPSSYLCGFILGISVASWWSSSLLASWGCVIFQVMLFFFFGQINQPGCLGWKLVVWADQSKDVWRSFQRHRRLDSWMLYYLQLMEKHHIYPPEN